MFDRNTETSNNISKNQQLRAYFTQPSAEIRKLSNGVKTSNFTSHEWALLEKFSPCLVFDDAEVLYPTHVGVSIYYGSSHPPSLVAYYKHIPFHVKMIKFLEPFGIVFLYDKFPYIYEFIRSRLQPVLMTLRRGLKRIRAARVLEYGIIYDADIEHIYDLEHIWVYLDAQDRPLGIKGSRHAVYMTQYDSPEKIRYHNGHPILYVDPGKHAHYTHPSLMHKPILRRVNTKTPGKVGMYPVHFFDHHLWEKIQPYYPGYDAVVKFFQTKYAHMPAFRFRKYLIPPRKMMIPWDQLEQEIPQYVINFLKQIPHEAKN